MAAQSRHPAHTPSSIRAVKISSVSSRPGTSLLSASATAARPCVAALPTLQARGAAHAIDAVEGRGGGMEGLLRRGEEALRVALEMQQGSQLGVALGRRHALDQDHHVDV